MSFIDHCPIYAFNKSLEDSANNKMISGKSTTSGPPISKRSPAFSPQRQAYSPRLTRNSLNSPITMKFENDTTPAFEKQKSPLKIEHVIDEHKSPSVDSIGDPLSTTRSQVFGFFSISPFLLFIFRDALPGQAIQLARQPQNLNWQNHQHQMILNL